ncbi:endolytic transglycosylase MltG [Candidatus Parcubacteria bacterium]|nr:endolytic transglycosylase MltG [Candidatus Parcubacteria bacterium]
MRLSILKNLFKKRAMVRVYGGLGLFFVFLLSWYFFSYRPPLNFPGSGIVTIPDGASLSAIANRLEKDNVITSPFWFTNFVLLFKHENKVVGGQYYFEKPLNVYAIARRVTSGDYNMDQLKTTIPEGSSVTEIAAIIKKNYPSFESERFIQLAREREGYLFPDTYLLGADAPPEKIVSILTATFDQKMQDPGIRAAIEKFGRPLHEVITMASILEGEARQTRTRQVIAGILWKRIQIGMPLQVDTAFRYVNGKTTRDLTLADLKIDSPYNTYLYQGLPPTPISNPGLDSIKAAVTPITTNYLFFLTDRDGNMHYAETHEEHAYNKDIYLD